MKKQVTEQELPDLATEKYVIIHGIIKETAKRSALVPYIYTWALH